MPLKPKVYLLLGDGGLLFSQGFLAFGRQLSRLGYEVDVRADSGRNTSAIITDMLAQPHDRSIVMFGYSLGANGCAWVAHDLARFRPEIDLMIGWDPTRNGPSLTSFPIGNNVHRCICFRQTLPWSPTNWFFGGGVYVSLGQTQVEIVSTWSDHVLVQFDTRLQKIAIDALELVG